jgi:hypothetical protein
LLVGDARGEQDCALRILRAERRARAAIEAAGALPEAGSLGVPAA